MSASYLIVSVVLILLLQQQSLCKKEDEAFKAMMKVKPNGELYSTAELIEECKHTGESHSVTTDDGYILTMFRVKPAKQPASVVLLQHGFLCSSDCFVTDPGSLAFTLSNAGFDVWINNVRGNAYSRSHNKLKPEDNEFWNFSFHEMGSKDLPAVIDYILKVTGSSKLHYIGHSMGSTAGFILTSTRPEYNQRLKSLVSLAPVVFLSKGVAILGPDGVAEDMVRQYMTDYRALGKVEVFPRKGLVTNDKLQMTCNDIDENFQPMCFDNIKHVEEVLGGAYMPSGQSFKTMEHYYQMLFYGVMRYFNMTIEENKKAYGSEEPPAYTDKFNQISAPVLLWTAEADELVMFKDVDNLAQLLPHVVADNRIADECIGHVGMLVPKTKSCIPVRAKIYSDIVEALKKLD